MRLRNRTGKRFRLPRRLPRLAAVLLASLALLLPAGCGGAVQGGSASGTITVASKNFTENIILGEIAAQMLEAKTSLKVVRKLNLGSTMTAFNALRSGQLDLYPDYTGTGLVDILKQKTMTDPQAVYETVQREYQKRFQIQWLKPLGMNNTYVMAVRQEDAQKYGLKSISDLSKVASNWVLGTEQEFLTRPDGYPGLQSVYGLHFKQVVAMDTGLKYDAMANHKVDVTDAFATDGKLLAYHLTALVDDKHLYPPYYGAYVVRMSTLKAHPEVEKVLDELAGRITDAKMQQMNYLVDEKGESVSKVAHDFLVREGLITG